MEYNFKLYYSFRILIPLGTGALALAWIMHELPTATADPDVPPGVLVPRTLDVLSSTPRVLVPAVARSHGHLDGLVTVIYA